MTERAAVRPLGAILRLTAASLQTAAGRLRDRAFGIPVRTGSGAGLRARSALARFRTVVLRATAVTLLGFGTAWAQATAPGTPISNTAQATFIRGASLQTTVNRNTVATLVEPARSSASLMLVRPSSVGAPGGAELFGPTQCVGAGGTQPLAPPIAIGGTPLDPTVPLPMGSTA